MPSNYITPNMFLTEPAIGVSLSPNWAQLLNADMGIIDSHNHTPGSGVQIPPSGLNINAALTMQGNDLIAINSLVFNGSIDETPDNLSVYTNGVDLFYTDSTGNAIQLTKNHQPNTSTGNIQGLPSTPDGDASIAWINAQSTFKFSQDDGSPGANIDVGTIVLRYPGSYPTPSGNYIALQAPTTLATGYALTLPAALPSTINFVTLDTLGNIAGITTVGGITGSNIVTNVNLNGDLVSAAGYPIVTMLSTTPDYSHSMRVARGNVATAGTFAQDDSVISVVGHVSGSGTYGVTLTTSFDDVPVVVATATLGGSYACNVAIVTANSFEVVVYNTTTGAPTDNAFSFIAIGNKA